MNITSLLEEKICVSLPLLNNIGREIEEANNCLQMYFDCLHDEGFHDASDDSLIYAIKHLASCAELLVKFRLMEEHWAFVFENVNKANESDLENGDFISVGFKQGVERLFNLCNINETLVNCLQLYKLRNKAQHFSIEESLEKILEVLFRSSDEIYLFTKFQVIPYLKNESAISDFKSMFDELREYANALKQIYDSLDISSRCASFS